MGKHALYVNMNPLLLPIAAINYLENAPARRKLRL